MGSAAHRKNRRKLALLVFLVVVAAAAYLFTDVSFANERLFRYAMKIMDSEADRNACHGGCDRRGLHCIPVCDQQYDCNALSSGNELSVYTDPCRGRVCGGIGKFPCGEREHFFCGGPCFDGSGGDSHLQLSVP